MKLCISTGEVITIITKNSTVFTFFSLHFFTFTFDKSIETFIVACICEMFYSYGISRINKMASSYKHFTRANNFHTTRLDGKVAIITASTDGIGFAIAKRLGNEGASVLISSRKEENVNKAVTSLSSEGIKVEGVVCHVSDAEQRQRLFDTAKTKFGGFDILVSNAAVNPAVSPVLETGEKIWDKIFDVNVKSSWLLAKEAYPELIKRGGGSIVFVSSIAGYQPMEPLGPYSISKTALLGLTKAIAYEVVHDNIRVNCVAPGIVATKFASAITSSEVGKDKSLSIVPMKRFGKPEEIASAVAFLVSEDASYVTGETLVVAGGTYAHL